MSMEESNNKPVPLGQFFGVIETKGGADDGAVTSFFIDGPGCNAGGEHDWSEWEEGECYGSKRCSKCKKLLMDHDIMFGP